MNKNFLFILSLFFLLIACQDDDIDVIDENLLTDITYAPEPYELPQPANFPKMFIPADNPLTLDGVALGRRLFFDPILSADSTQSCSSCHHPRRAFTDGLATSAGIDGINGKRSSMSLINVGYFDKGLFWDGRANSLEDQAILPVEDPLELHDTWPNVERKLRSHPIYPKLFREAFGIESKTEISRALAVKALAQYERSLVSGNSRYDQALRNEIFLSDAEIAGEALFFDLPNSKDAECSHCHINPLMTTDDFFNNGIEDVASLDDFPDLGRGVVTGKNQDKGKFRATTLRNIALTAPYMHDGRFATLEEVIEHYNSGGHNPGNLDPNIRPLNLTEEEKGQLIAFLHALTDTSYYGDPHFFSPFQ